MTIAPLAVVAGGGGFIGGHLVKRLRMSGYRVRSVDIKPLPEWHQVHEFADNVVADLSELTAAQDAVQGANLVFNLAADMGGIGYIENFRAQCMLSVLINTHLLKASRAAGVRRFFYASSACVYSSVHQSRADVPPLREDMAYPAMPEDGYGWEKLFSERLCRHFTEDFGLETRVARFHNVYGPYGTWTGGREKAPAAICRKIAEAAASKATTIDVWGDGLQTRSFMYIDDCVEGIMRIMGSDLTEPINLGSSELVTINQLVDVVSDIAGVHLERNYQLDAPRGVRGRNSDNTMILAALGWEPNITLASGLAQTYAWVSDQVRDNLKIAVSGPSEVELTGSMVAS